MIKLPLVPLVLASLLAVPALAQEAAAPAQTPAPAQAAAPGRTEILEQVLVKVNGDIITKTQLEDMQVTALRQRGQQVNPADLQKELQAVTPEILVNAVTDLLIQQRGAELGYRVTDERYEQVLANIRKENQLEDDAKFKAALQQEGLTEAQLRKNLERSMVRNQVEQAEVFGRVQVTEPEEREYYEAHKHELATPAAITLREILVAVQSDGEKLNVGLDEEAKAKAEAAHKRALAGESFEKLVAEVSDAPSKSNSGLIGPVNISELSADIVKMLEGAKAGTITPVFRTARGYQIIKVETMSEATVPEFEQVRRQIADRIFRGKAEAEFSKYIEKLRSTAIIEWKNAELKKLYEEQLKKMTSGTAAS